MSFVFIPFGVGWNYDRLKGKFDGVQEVIKSTKGDGFIVVALSAQDPTWGTWAAFTRIEDITEISIPESALRKYASSETLLNLQKARGNQADPVEVPIVAATSSFDVKPCPFCGEPPSVHEEDLFPAFISCRNLQCFVNPRVENSRRLFVEKVIEIWNTRPNE